MTRKREDGNPPSEFSDWLRGALPGMDTKAVDSIDSWRGYRNYNLDYLWTKDGIDNFLLIEEKRFMGELKEGQIRAFMKLTRILYTSHNFLGLFIVRFENTNPGDGKIYLTKFPRNLPINWASGKWDIFEAEKEISTGALIEFLELDWIVNE